MSQETRRAWLSYLVRAAPVGAAVAIVWALLGWLEEAAESPSPLVIGTVAALACLARDLWHHQGRPATASRSYARRGLVPLLLMGAWLLAGTLITKYIGFVPAAVAMTATAYLALHGMPRRSVQAHQQRRLI